MRLLKSLSNFFWTTDEPEPEKPREEARHTVLVIDDDPLMLEAVSRVLREAGFNVLKSTTGPKGLNMLRYGGAEIRVLVLDYHMPKFDGSDTLAFARKLNPRIKIIGLTGVDARLLPSAFREGVEAVVTKPFDNQQLVAQLQALADAEPAPAMAAPNGSEAVVAA
jgi:CheY-like chemotaxis protein